VTAAAAVRLGAFTTCNSCSAVILWYPTSWPVGPDTRKIPLDSEPRPDGNVVLEARGQGSIARVLRDGETPPSGPRYVTHFVTCPDAGQHRRRR
jgi:hypothetical protein